MGEVLAEIRRQHAHGAKRPRIVGHDHAANLSCSEEIARHHATCPAKGHEREVARVVPPGDEDGAHGLCHICRDHLDDSFGGLIQAQSQRLGDTADVAIYRNMVELIRDRVRDLKQQGMSLAQVRAARPTLDFDGIYGAPDRFIDAVYETLE